MHIFYGYFTKETNDLNQTITYPRKPTRSYRTASLIIFYQLTSLQQNEVMGQPIEQFILTGQTPATEFVCSDSACSSLYVLPRSSGDDFLGKAAKGGFKALQYVSKCPGIQSTHDVAWCHMGRKNQSGKGATKFLRMISSQKLKLGALQK